MELVFVLIAALTPVAIAMRYILKKDSVQPEPTRCLAVAFGLGVLSAVLSTLLCLPIGLFFGMQIDTEVYTSIFGAIADAFLMAAIPEELAKFIMLWFLLRNNSYFDEKFDGIVYAVCIGMGFAGIENILYLVDGIGDGSWISIGISRALFSIPGHFFFAVLMGYYYSLYHFGIDRSPKAKAMILAAPIIAHGLFDAILMSMQVNETFAVVGMFLFLYFFNMLKKKGRERIDSLMNQ